MVDVYYNPVGECMFDNKWEEIFSKKSWGKYPSEPVIQFMARNFYSVSPRTAIKVLDLGCGGGAHTAYLAREGFDVYALDGSVSAIHQTQQLLAQNHLSAQLTVGDITHIDYPDAFFDIVIDSNVIQHNTWSTILAIHLQLKRVLKSGGQCFSMMVNTETTGQSGARFIEENTYTDMNNSYITPGVLIHLLTVSELLSLTSGYQDVSLETITKVQEKSSDKISHFIWSGKNV